MARVTVKLPGMLAGIAGRGEIALEAATLRGALDELTRLYPTLAVHLFDESGAFRQHVFCFHNQTNTRWLASLDVPLSPGDEITILQAVSGG